MEDAVSAASSPGTTFLAGGTNLVDLMKLGVAQPTALVDVRGLALDFVDELPSGGLRIGATTRNSDLATHLLVRERYPALAQALLSGASAQVRNVATLAGNLLQRTRCPYFQDISKPCNKRRPGSGCPAVEGEHRGLAIFGHSPGCVATHPSDMAVALAAFEARVEARGPRGTRSLPISELYRLPEDHPDRDTTLQPGELIVAAELDPVEPADSVCLPQGAREGFVCLRARLGGGRGRRFRRRRGRLPDRAWRGGARPLAGAARGGLIARAAGYP